MSSNLVSYGKGKQARFLETVILCEAFRGNFWTKLSSSLYSHTISVHTCFCVCIYLIFRFAYLEYYCFCAVLFSVSHSSIVNIFYYLCYIYIYIYMCVCVCVCVYVLPIYHMDTIYIYNVYII